MKLDNEGVTLALTAWASFPQAPSLSIVWVEYGSYAMPGSKSRSLSGEVLETMVTWTVDTDPVLMTEPTFIPYTTDG